MYIRLTDLRFSKKTDTNTTIITKKRQPTIDQYVQQPTFKQGIMVHVVKCKITLTKKNIYILI